MSGFNASSSRDSAEDRNLTRFTDPQPSRPRTTSTTAQGDNNEGSAHNEAMDNISLITQSVSLEDRSTKHSAEQWLSAPSISSSVTHSTFPHFKKALPAILEAVGPEITSSHSSTSTIIPPTALVIEDLSNPSRLPFITQNETAGSGELSRPTTFITHEEDGSRNVVTSQEFFDQLVRNSRRWKNIFIEHRSTDIRDSLFVISHSTSPEAIFYNPDLTLSAQIIFTCEGSDRNGIMEEFLTKFCQTIEVPTELTEEMFVVVAVITSQMLRQYDGTNLVAKDWPYGIRGLMTVDKTRQLRLLKQKFPSGAKIYRSGNVTVHADEGMIERGLINLSIVSKRNAYIVIVNVKSPDFENEFGPHPSRPFFSVLAASCCVFGEAVEYLADPSNNTEAAVLARQIGRSLFDEEVKEAKKKNEEEEEKMETRKKQKRKNKKKNRGNGKGKEEETDGELVVGAETSEEGVVSSMVVTSSSTSVDDKVDSSTAVASSPTPNSPPVPSSHSLHQGPSFFSFRSLDQRLLCAFDGCTILANASHPSAVVCPRCTEYSYTRYCSDGHSLADTKQHFLSGRCGSSLLQQVQRAVDDSEESIPASCLPPKPYVQETNDTSTRPFIKGILERHRQALYRSMDGTGVVDYFIFNDIDNIITSDHSIRYGSPEYRKQQLQAARGTGSVCATVVLPATDVRKANFNDTMNLCLGFGFAAGTLHMNDCMWLFSVMKEYLQEIDEWDARMEERIAVQMGFEFGWNLPLSMRE